MSIALRDIRRRIKSIRQIHKVTSALQSVASARLESNRRLLRNTQRYFERLKDVVAQAASAASGTANTLLEPRRKGDVMLIVFGADRGLCGAFNSDLLKAAVTFIEDRKPRPVKTTVMGKIVNRRLRRRGFHVGRLLDQPNRHAREGVIKTLTETLTNQFLSGKANEIHLLYTRFVHNLEWTPMVERLLPVEISRADAAQSRADAPPSGPLELPGFFEPGPGEMISHLLPEYIYRAVECAFLNSLVSENAARRAAMTRAADNAHTVLDDLVLVHNRLRQENITTEMLELSAGRLGP